MPTALAALALLAVAWLASASEPTALVVSVSGAPSKGAREAPLVIIDYSDYQ